MRRNVFLRPGFGRDLARARQAQRFEFHGASTMKASCFWQAQTQLPDWKPGLSASANEAVAGKSQLVKFGRLAIIPAHHPPNHFRFACV